MTKPLTSYEKEITILHAEARLDSELIEEFKGLANKYKQVIERVHKVLALWVYDIASTTEQDYYIQILEALDGEQ